MPPDHVDRLLSIPDREIITAIRSGDEAMYSKLARAYVHPLYLWGAHYFDNESEAEDAVSEVFMQLWMRRREWHVHTSIEAYLFGAVRNKALMSNRDSRRHIELLDAQVAGGDYPGMSSHADDPSDIVANVDVRERLQAVIDTLPSNYRAVLQLKIERDMSYNEIASIMGITPANAAKLASRAVKTLKERLNS